MTTNQEGAGIGFEASTPSKPIIEEVVVKKKKGWQRAGPRVETKLNEKFFAAAKAVLEKDDNALIYTQSDIIFLINEKLDPVDRVAESTFDMWKKKYKDLDYEDEEVDVEVKERGERFMRMMRMALLKKKGDLFKEMKATNKWSKFAWIIERKFDEWNIKKDTGFSLEVGKDKDGGKYAKLSLTNPMDAVEAREHIKMLLEAKE